MGAAVGMSVDVGAGVSVGSAVGKTGEAVAVGRPRRVAVGAIGVVVVLEEQATRRIATIRTSFFMRGDYNSHPRRPKGFGNPSGLSTPSSLLSLPPFHAKLPDVCPNNPRRTPCSTKRLPPRKAATAPKPRTN